MNTVGELSILFGLQPKRAEWRRGEAVIQGLRRAAIGFGAIFGAGVVGKALIGFNADIEDAKNQIAGMLALARRTELNDQLQYANQLYDGLRKKAAELPGTTKDYINMLGMLVQPMAKANMDMAQMQTLVVDTMVAARGLGEGWQKAARDIGEFINFGKFNAVDTFIRRILGAAGYEADDATKKRLRAMTVQQRAEIAMAGVGAKAIKDLGERQADSFRGRVDKLKEAVQQFLGAVGLPLFEALKDSIKDANVWLIANEKAVGELAKSIGGGLVTTFKGFQGFIKWLMDHKDAAVSALFGISAALLTMGIRAAVAWAMTLGPLGKLMVVLTSGFYIFQKLRDYLTDVGAALVAAFSVAVLWKFIPAVKSATAAMANYGRTAAAAHAAAAGGGAARAVGSLAGDYIGREGPGFLGAAGKSHHPSANGFGPAGAGAVAGGAARAGRWARLSSAVNAGVTFAGRAFGVAAATQIGWEVGKVLKSTVFSGYFEEMARRRKFADDLQKSQMNYTISELAQKLEEGRLIKKEGKTTEGERYVNFIHGDTLIIIKGSPEGRDEIIKEFEKTIKEQRERMLRDATAVLKGNK